MIINKDDNVGLLSNVMENTIRNRNRRLLVPSLATPSAALFAIGLASAFDFNLVGTIFASDLILIASLPFLLFKHNVRTHLRASAPFIIFATLWLTGAIITDLFRQTLFQDYARGWAKIIFFILSFVSILLISEAKIIRIMAYFAGLAGAGILSSALFPDAYQAIAPWKFGYANPIAILIIIFASLAQRSSFLRESLPALAMAAINLLMNYRSMFAMLVATCATSAMTWAARKLLPGKRIVSATFAIVFIAVCALGLWGGSIFYGHFAESGALGEGAKSKYETQSQGNLGPLLGGRTESLVSTKAIADSPILGHGSWAADREYVALRILLLRERGIKTYGNPFQSELIPSHSYILGSWVESGIAGGLFWAFCWIAALRAIMLLVDIRSTATPFAAFMLIQLLWNIPFSPFGADVRFYVAGELCVVIWAIRQGRMTSTGNTKSHVRNKWTAHAG